MRRIGLFGGSFDPVHKGHQALAEAARTGLSLAQVWWVPAGLPWQKARPLSPVQDRLQMLSLALAALPAGVHRIETCETGRRGNSYTIDTVQQLSDIHPDVQWHLLMGWDQFRGLPSWHRWQELLARVQLAVARRPMPHGQESGLPDELKGVPFDTVEMALTPLSSTEVRKRAAAGLSLHGLVEPAVARYIESSQPYRGA